MVWGGDDDQEVVAEAIALTDIADMAHRRVDELSGEPSQRVCVALVLVQRRRSPGGGVPDTLTVLARARAPIGRARLTARLCGDGRRT